MKNYLQAGRKALLVALFLPFIVLWFSAAFCYPAGVEDPTLLRLNSPRFMFLQVCSQCHEPERGYLVIGDPGEWASTVSRMMVKRAGHITLEKVNQFVMVMRYGTEYQHYQSAFFEARCGGCHDRELMKDLNEGATSWHNRSAAISQDNEFWITNEEYELILFGLRRKGSI